MEVASSAERKAKKYTAEKSAYPPPLASKAVADSARTEWILSNQNITNRVFTMSERKIRMLFASMAESRTAGLVKSGLVCKIAFRGTTGDGRQAASVKRKFW